MTADLAGRLAEPALVAYLHSIARVEGFVWVLCDTLLLASLIDIANSCRRAEGLVPRRWFFRAACATGLGALWVGAAPDGVAFDHAVIGVATTQFLMAGFLLLLEIRRVLRVLDSLAAGRQSSSTRTNSSRGALHSGHRSGRLWPRGMTWPHWRHR